MAAFPFAPNTKFAAIHLCRCASRGLSEVLSFGGGLSAHSTPVMDLSDMDKGRIGKDYSDAFEGAIALMASMSSESAGVLDAESIHLEHRAYMWFYGMLTQGVPEFWPGIITIGSKQQDDREPWANRIVIMDRFFRNTEVVPF